MNPSQLQFQSLFDGTPLESSELTDATLVPIQVGGDIKITTLGAIKAYAESGGGSGGQLPWEVISASGTITIGKSYVAMSSSSGLTITLPTGIPVRSAPFAIHSRGGPTTIDPGSNYVIMGATGSLVLADGETVFLFHVISGQLEII